MKKYTIFVSSTFSDLSEYRESIHNAILTDGNFPLAMENFISSNQPQWETIKPLIDNCDYYILIIGFRYGSVEIESGLSYTEKEYDYAKSIGKPILSFLLDEEFMLEKDTDLTYIQSFRDKILSNGKLAKICKDRNNLSSDIISSLHTEIINFPKNGWMKSSNETYIGLSLKQIDDILDDKEKDIIYLFEKENTESIKFSKFIKEYKLTKNEFIFYIEHLEKLQLLYFDNQYISDDSNYCELLPYGRKFLMKFIK